METYTKKFKHCYVNSIKKVCAKSNKKTKSLKICISIFLIIIIFMITISPSLAINSVYNGLLIWAKCVLPSLFPFMFFTKIITDLDFISAISKKFEKINKILFCAPNISAYIFFMSIISGYPVGAKMISDYYSLGYITEKQANKLTTFCSTSGPLFIIGSVGTAMFLNKKVGYIMFFCHIVGSILNGIIFRNFYADNTKIEIGKNNINQINLSQILPNTMKDSILSILIVGGYIAIAFLIIDLLNNYNILLPINYALKYLLLPFGLNFETASAISSGLLEVSKGCLMLSKLNLPLKTMTSIGSFLIGFGGLSVFFQATTFLSKCKINYKFYILQKICHGIICGILAFIVCSIFGI